MIGTIPADLVNYFAHVLRIEQKLAYIYGWPSFLDEDDEIDDETMYRLILFLGVIMQVGGINISLTNFAAHTAAVGIAKTIEKQALTKTFWYPILKRVMAVMGVKVTKKSFANVVSKAVPVVGGLVSGGITWATYKPGATSLKNHLRLLPQATGGVVDEEELKSMLDAEDERERGELADLLDDARAGAAAAAGTVAEGAANLAGTAAEGASWLAGNAVGAAQSVAGAIGSGIAGLASMFAKPKDDGSTMDGDDGKTEGAEESSIDESDTHDDATTEANDPVPEPEVSEASVETVEMTRSVTDVAGELRSLKALLDDGIISQEDFDAKKSQLLGL